MLAREAPEIGAEERADEIALCAARLAEEERRGLREVLPLELGRRVHADHLALVDAPFKLLQLAELAGQALWKVGAIEEHRVVAGKEASIVLEHAQLEALDLGVGRIDVHHVDTTRGGRLVRQPVIEPRGQLRQPVRALEAIPAVRTADEFLRQAELHLWMAGKVRELRDAQGLRAVRAHGERIAVVEAKRDARLQALRRERGVDLGKARLPGQAYYFGRHGTGVLGVDVDRAGLERREHDAGIAESRLVLAAAGARQDLAEDVRLGETPRADLDAVLRVRRARQREQNDDRGFQGAMRSTCTRQS